jgi:DnaJ-class molecular chaperone
MAGSGDDEQDLAGATHEPRECMACRGTGRVISNLGGSPSTVQCPWCEGSGLRPATIDAQAHWAGQLPDTEASPSGDAPASSAD